MRRGFPVAEVLVLGAIGCGIAGALSWGSSRSLWLIAVATALGCLAGFSTALREHLAGHRAHASVLGGTCAAVVAVTTLVLHVPAVVALVAATATFVLTTVALQRRFERRRL